MREIQVAFSVPYMSRAISNILPFCIMAFVDEIFREYKDAKRESETTIRHPTSH